MDALLDRYALSGGALFFSGHWGIICVGGHDIYTALGGFQVDGSSEISGTGKEAHVPHCYTCTGKKNETTIMHERSTSWCCLLRRGGVTVMIRLMFFVFSRAANYLWLVVPSITIYFIYHTHTHFLIPRKKNWGRRVRCLNV